MNENMDIIACDWDKIKEYIGNYIIYDGERVK